MKNKKLFTTALIILILDRITKLIILNKHILYYPIVKNHLSITSIANTGAAFSLFENQQFALIIISGLSVLFFIYYFSRENIGFLPQLAWGLLIGGAIGNLADRISYNCVIDFINFESLHFPVFNIADTAISVGAVLLCYHYILESKKDA